MAEFVKHTNCPKCGSKNNLALYNDGSASCFGLGCGYYKLSEEYKNNPDGSKPKIKSKAGQVQEAKVKMKESITPEKAESIKESTSFDKTGYRGITHDTNKFFGVRYAYDEAGDVAEVYYPITREYELAGYKIRSVPKAFSAVGATGNDCDLFGAFRFRAGGKYVLIVEGEHDCLAAYQMFKNYQEAKNSPFVTAVVSITVGAGNPAKQLQSNYDFLNTFEHIILGLDADTVGSEAIEKCMTALPKGKVRIANWTKYKDPNDYLKNDKEQHFISDFYNAKQFMPAGVIASSDLYVKIQQQAVIEKVPFPPFMKVVEEMIGGGIILGHIYVIAAQTSIGKTALVNEMIYHWIFHSPHLIGVVSMELNAGQYGETLLSRHLQSKLARMSMEEKLEHLKSPRVIAKGKELFETEDGQPRFYLVDDRDGTVEQIQEVIEQMVIGSGVKIVVLDVLQDVIDGMSNEEQAVFMKWCKSMIKSHGISLVLISHMRKRQGGTTSLDVTEDDIHGSSTIMKSSSVNILLARDKMHEDEIERNRTHVMISKSRITGDTGPAGSIYYDNKTHTMHSFEEYWSTRERPSPPDLQEKQDKPLNTFE